MAMAQTKRVKYREREGERKNVFFLLIVVVVYILVEQMYTGIR